MTDQQVFDTVLTHLRRQGMRSATLEGCAYRGENGNKCAVGILIPDALYTESIENMGIGHITEMGGLEACLHREGGRGDLARILHTFNFTNLDLLGELQLAHDYHMPLVNGDSMQEWEAEMQKLAIKHSLTYTAP